MLKMIIADDEMVIIRGIKKILDWSALGIEIVGEYMDGNSAWTGILKSRPDIALLDISMPGRTGIEILQEISRLQLETAVIFVSGFQDFSYAKAALTYGAKGYLLKPLIRDELTQCLESVILNLEKKRRDKSEEKHWKEQEKQAEREKYIQLEKGPYLPVYAEMFFDGNESSQERKLMNFAFTSFLDEYLGKYNLGIWFKKNGNLVLILKEQAASEGRQYIEKIKSEVQDRLQKKVGFIVGAVVSEMSEIPESYGRCLLRKGYFFFRKELPSLILDSEGEVFFQKPNTEELNKCSREISSHILMQKEDSLKRAWKSARRQICLLADGKKEDACYHFCNLLCMVQGEIEKVTGGTVGETAGQILEKCRQTEDYDEMIKAGEKYLEEIAEKALSKHGTGARKEIRIAKQYIESHYQEELSLNVLADKVHMNPYYFSNFFKKNTGEGFKEYVNRVRLEHAVSLLLSTDLKNYEIAEQAGFKDSRAFTNTFVQMYGEKPGEYKKKIAARNKEQEISGKI